MVFNMGLTEDLFQLRTFCADDLFFFLCDMCPQEVKVPEVIGAVLEPEGMCVESFLKCDAVIFEDAGDTLPFTQIVGSVYKQ